MVLQFFLTDYSLHLQFATSIAFFNVPIILWKFRFKPVYLLHAIKFSMSLYILLISCFFRNQPILWNFCILHEFWLRFIIFMRFIVWSGKCWYFLYFGAKINIPLKFFMLLEFFFAVIQSWKFCATKYKFSCQKIKTLMPEDQNFSSSYNDHFIFLSVYIFLNLFFVS